MGWNLQVQKTCVRTSTEDDGNINVIPDYAGIDIPLNHVFDKRMSSSNQLSRVVLASFKSMPVTSGSQLPR
jgi:hypothetical protein